MSRGWAVAVIGCVALASCSEKEASCWKPPEITPASDQALLEMTASPDRSVQAAGFAQRAERCVDKLANTYGRGRDAADVVAEAVVQECQSDLQLQAEREVEQGFIDEYTRDLIAKSKRRALILIVRDRAAKCI